MAGGLSIRDLKEAVRFARENQRGPEFKEGLPRELFEIHWLQITSDTKDSDSLYPSVRYDRSPAGNDYVGPKEVCLLFPPNDEVLRKNVYYPCHLFGVASDKTVIYALLVAHASDDVIEFFCHCGDLYLVKTNASVGSVEVLEKHVNCCVDDAPCGSGSGSGSGNGECTFTDSILATISASMTIDVSCVGSISSLPNGCYVSPPETICLRLVSQGDCGGTLAGHNCATFEGTIGDLSIHLLFRAGAWIMEVYCSGQKVGVVSSIGASTDCLPPEMQVTFRTGTGSVSGFSWDSVTFQFGCSQLNCCAGNCTGDLTATLTNKVGTFTSLPDTITLTCHNNPPGGINQNTHYWDNLSGLSPYFLVSCEPGGYPANNGPLAAYFADGVNPLLQGSPNSGSTCSPVSGSFDFDDGAGNSCTLTVLG